MKEFLRRILIKITGIGWCDTPKVQIQKAEIEAKNELELNSKLHTAEVNKS